MKKKFAILTAIGIFLFCAGCSAPDAPAFDAEARATEMPVETSAAPVGDASVETPVAEAAEELSIVAAEVRYDADVTVSVTFTDDSVHTDTIAGTYTTPTTVEEITIIDLDMDGNNELIVNLREDAGNTVDTVIYAIRDGALQRVFSPADGDANYGYGAVALFISDLPYVAFSAPENTSIYSYHNGVWENAIANS